MANFSKEKSTRGRHIKGGQKRTEQLPMRVSPQELAMFDELLTIMIERRKLGKSRADLLVYLMEREHEKQQNLRPF